MIFSLSRPDLIQYDKLSKSNAMHNLNNAFTTAEQNLGLTRLLDAEGIYHNYIVFLKLICACMKNKNTIYYLIFTSSLNLISIDKYIS